MATKQINLIPLLLIAQFFLACNSKKDIETSKIVTEHIITAGEELYEVTPPPPGFKSNFKSIEEWLANICDNEPPNKEIMNYNFGLFESPDEYTIFIVGLNKYPDEHIPSTRIDFEPANMYFLLPESQYAKLSGDQLKERLTAQLKLFINTEKFKSSYLAKAGFITTDFGGRIWSK